MEKIESLATKDETNIEGPKSLEQIRVETQLLGDVIALYNVGGLDLVKLALTKR